MRAKPRRLFRDRPAPEPTARRPRIAASLSPCVVCGGRPVASGVWHADEASSGKMGSPPPRLRTVIYPLCEVCFGKMPGLVTTVEDILMKRHDPFARPGEN